MEIFHIDLDSADPVVNGPIFKYSMNQVNNSTITSFHVRGSSAKEKINLNKQLMIYVMHGHHLYGWV